MALQVQAQADTVGDAVAVLRQQRVGLVAGARLTPIGTAIVIDVTAGDAEHERIVGTGMLQQQRAGNALVDAAEADTRSAAGARLVAELGLGRDQVDHTAHRATAVQHRTRPLDHLDALEQAEIHERCDRPLRLGGIDPQAIDHDHHAFLLEPTQHRVLPPGTVGLRRQARLAAQQLAGYCAARRRSVEDLDRLWRLQHVGGIAFGGDDLGAEHGVGCDRRQGSEGKAQHRRGQRAQTQMHDSSKGSRAGWRRLACSSGYKDRTK